MAIQVYQSKAGYLRVGNTEFSLDGVQMTYRFEKEDYLISIYSSNRKSAYLLNGRLSNIEDNNGNTHATIGDWNTWWDSLLMNDFADINGQVTSQYFYSTDPVSTRKLRMGVRNDVFVVDRELTETGFDGSESTDDGVTGDWLNIYYNS